MAEWNSNMDEAPRDGTPILIYDPHVNFDGFAGIACGRFYNVANGCWWGTCASSVVAQNPTHWMPLPQPPEDK